MILRILLIPVAVIAVVAILAAWAGLDSLRWQRAWEQEQARAAAQR